MFKWLVLGSLLIAFLLTLAVEIADYRKHWHSIQAQTDTHLTKNGLAGALAVFLDAMGIGSFNTLSAMMKGFNLVRDRDIPGTLMVSTAAIAPLVSMVYVTTINVSPTTLLLLVIPAGIGSFIGASFLTKISESMIQLAMSIALSFVALLVLLGQLNLIPIGGEAFELSDGPLIFGMIMMTALGFIVNFGVGLFAPCMILLYSLGMHPEAVFPIMFCGTTIIQAVSCFPIIKSGAYNRKASLAITAFGIPAALAGTLFVSSLSADSLQWIVLIVVIYTAASLYLSYRKNRQSA